VCECCVVGVGVGVLWCVIGHIGNSLLSVFQHTKPQNIVDCSRMVEQCNNTAVLEYAPTYSLQRMVI